MEPAMNPLTICCAVLLGGIFVLLIGGALWLRIDRFCEELRYVNMELCRCADGERSRWRRYRRKLWLGLFFLRRDSSNQASCLESKYDLT